MTCIDGRINRRPYKHYFVHVRTKQEGDSLYARMSPMLLTPDVSLQYFVKKAQANTHSYRVKTDNDRLFKQ